MRLLQSAELDYEMTLGVKVAAVAQRLCRTDSV